MKNITLYRISEGLNYAEVIFMKVFVFMHGIACMVTNGEFDLTDDETLNMLKSVITQFIS